MAEAQLIPLLPAEEWARRERRRRSPCPELWDLLDEVMDPEVPVLSLWDLGVLQDVRQDKAGLVITMTPTYSGCPALETMREDILAKLKTTGFHDVRVETRLSPAWTTDWLSASARQRLMRHGISPPVIGEQVACPQCGSLVSEQVSEFGSTACKALYRCKECLEPFDYFKPL